MTKGLLYLLLACLTMFAFLAGVLLVWTYLFLMSSDFCLMKLMSWREKRVQEEGWLDRFTDTFIFVGWKWGTSESWWSRCLLSQVVWLLALIRFFWRDFVGLWSYQWNDHLTQTSEFDSSINLVFCFWLLFSSSLGVLLYLIWEMVCLWIGGWGWWWEFCWCLCRRIRLIGSELCWKGLRRIRGVCKVCTVRVYTSSFNKLKYMTCLLYIKHANSKICKGRSEVTLPSSSFLSRKPSN